MTKRRILIPLDGSEFREQALSLVNQVFDPVSSEILLLLVDSSWGISNENVSYYYALAGDMWYYPMDDVVEQSLEERERFRAELSARLQREVVKLRKAGYTVYTRLRTGELASTIVREAQDWNADVIAMATHGRTGLNRLLYGSVADQVLRKSSVPVMMMRPPMPLPHQSDVPVGALHY